MSQPRPSLALLNEWYAKAAQAGFEDVEHDGQLKHATGITDLAGLDSYAVQQPLEPIAGAWPEIARQGVEAFVDHPRFAAACQELCTHGNSRWALSDLSLAWKLHGEGLSIRQIASQTGIHRDMVFRAIKKLTSTMHLIEDDVSEENVRVVLRELRDADLPMIHSTWRNSLWYDIKRNETGAAQFYKDVSRYIKTLLSMPTTKIRIACLADDANHIVGYSAMSTSNLEWVYIKFDYRKSGVATMLCPGLKSVSKPRTKVGEAIAKKLNMRVLDE